MRDKQHAVPFDVLHRRDQLEHSRQAAFVKPGAVESVRRDSRSTRAQERIHASRIMIVGVGTLAS